MDRARWMLAAGFLLSLAALVSQAAAASIGGQQAQHQHRYQTECSILIQWVVSHVAVFLPVALVLNQAEVAVARDTVSRVASGGFDLHTSRLITAAVHDNFFVDVFIPIGLAAAALVGALASQAEVIMPGMVLAVMGTGGACAVDTMGRGVLLYVVPPEHDHASKMGLVLQACVLFACLPGFLLSVLDLRACVVLAPVALCIIPPFTYATLFPQSTCARALACSWFRCGRLEPADPAHSLKVWFNLPLLPEPVRQVATRSAWKYVTVFVSTIVIASSVSFVAVAVAFADMLCAIDQAPGGWASGEHLSLYNADVRAALATTCSDRSILSGSFARLLISLTFVTLCVALILVTIVGRLSTLLELRQTRLQDTNEEAAGMLRWLSHECRSPAAVALLVLDSMKHTTLRRLQRMSAEGGASKVPGHRRGASFVSASSALIEAGDGRSPLALAVIPDHKASMSTASSKTGDQAGAGAAASLARLEQSLSEDVAALEQPLTMLSGVLDNMLVYLRAKQQVRGGSGRGLASAPLDVSAALRDFFELTGHLSMTYDAPESPQFDGSVHIQASASADVVTVAGPQALHGLCGAGLKCRSSVTAATLKQVLVNLFTNSLKYGLCESTDGRKQVLLDLSVSVHPHEAREQLTSHWLHSPRGAHSSTPLYLMKITLADHGRGMSEDEMDSLFRPFSRLRSGMQQQGTGLGLWLMRELLQSQGGNLTVASPGRDQGCAFTLAFPVLMSPEAAAAVLSACALPSAALAPHSAGLPARAVVSVAASPPGAPPVVPTGGASSGSGSIPPARRSHSNLRSFVSRSRLSMHVLLVDDSKPLRTQMARALKRLGCTVVTAKDGEEALATLHNLLTPLQCMICDMSMPVMDGPALVEAVRQLEADGTFFAQPPPPTSSGLRSVSGTASAAGSAPSHHGPIGGAEQGSASGRSSKGQRRHDPTQPTSPDTSMRGGPPLQAIITRSHSAPHQAGASGDAKQCAPETSVHEASDVTSGASEPPAASQVQPQLPTKAVPIPAVAAAPASLQLIDDSTAATGPHETAHGRGSRTSSLYETGREGRHTPPPPRWASTAEATLTAPVYLGTAPLAGSASTTESAPMVQAMQRPPGSLCRLPIIGLTGNALDIDLEVFQAAGADEVLTKPVRAEDMLLAVHEVAKQLHVDDG